MKHINKNYMNFYEKHMMRQGDLKKIHEDAIKNTPTEGVDRSLMCVIRLFKKDGNNKQALVEESVLRRGYKIQYLTKEDRYELFLTTTTDFYKYVTDAVIDELLEKGFMRTVDEHQIKRDRKKIEYYNRKIDKANSDRNDSLMVHWRQRRIELIEKISRIEENFTS